MKIPKVSDAPKDQIFTNINCCGPCPSNRPFNELDPEAQDSYLGNLQEYMRDFKCAFRGDGNCKGHALNRLKYHTSKIPHESVRKFVETVGDAPRRNKENV